MATDTRLGEELAGYRIEALIARGGMGVVYRATDPELSRQVALKVIAPELARDPAFKERFLSEMKVAAALEHPHVCPVYRAGEAEGELYVCMRLLEGGDLSSKVASEGLLSPERTAEIVSQLASALDLAHSRSLLHRDVKPENVLLDAEGNAYLTDFGLAGAIWQVEEEPLLAGTLAYLAPERCQGEPALAASDQYALACLATTLLTGEPPFTREHEAALLYAHLREEPPSLAEHGLARIDPVLQQALAKDPAERYESCSAFADDLAAALARPERVGGEAWPESLPRPATRLVGRQRELGELRALLEDPKARLVTLTGPGGTGKTRLALQAAAESALAFQDGVHWVSLAPLRDPAYALSAIAQALEVQEQPPASLSDTLGEALAGRRCLLVLDNAEHLLPEIADDIATLRDIPSGPTLLITSRERLDLQAERLYPVPSLQEAEAAELFSDRALYLDPHHDPADPAIATLCERLDALPLALELAAARSDLYSPTELVSALEGHLELLKGARDHDPRHQTLTATIAWSYDLLSGEEQRAFRSLSVFAGGCTAEAAQEVAGADPALLQSLVAKSLLRTRESASGRRYVMLETIRQYAAERLAQAGEEAEAEARHAQFYCGHAVAVGATLEGAGMAEAVALFEPDLENLRLALLLQSEADPSSMIVSASALRRLLLYYRADMAAEVWGLVNAALVAPHIRRDVRAAGLMTAGSLASAWGLDSEAATRQLDEAIALLRGLDDPVQLVRALNSRGGEAYNQGDFAGARLLFVECNALAREVEDAGMYAASLGNLGAVLIEEGDFSGARTYLEEARQLHRVEASRLRVEESAELTIVDEFLAIVELCEGRFDRARVLVAQSLMTVDGVTPASTSALWIMARCDLADGDLEGARERLAAAVEYYVANTDDSVFGSLFLALAKYAACVAAYVESLELLGFAGESESGSVPQTMWRDEVLDALGSMFDASVLARHIAQGQALERDRALELAERVLARPVIDLA